MFTRCIINLQLLILQHSDQKNGRGKCLACTARTGDTLSSSNTGIIPTRVLSASHRLLTFLARNQFTTQLFAAEA